MHAGKNARHSSRLPGFSQAGCKYDTRAEWVDGAGGRWWVAHNPHRGDTGFSGIRARQTGRPMADNSGSPGGGPFNFGPEDFDRFAREASDGLRDVFGKLFEGQAGTGAWSALFDDGRTRTRRRAEPETTGDTGSGVWAVFVIDDDGGARVEQVFATELDALRALAAGTTRATTTAGPAP